MQGHVTREELLAHARTAVETLVAHGMHLHLVDLRRVDSADDLVDTFYDLNREATGTSHLRVVRTAIVAEADLVFGLSRMYQGVATTRSPDMEVFRSMDEATAWLTGEDVADRPA
jgi:hypothetical protein